MMSNKKYNCRKFLKLFVVVGGGMVFGFSWFIFCVLEEVVEVLELELFELWVEINGFFKIGDNGVVIIYSFNFEIG